jgi:hypothetical protein
VKETGSTLQETGVVAALERNMSTERLMNPIFSKLPRNYAADAVWSRLFFQKKSGTCTVGGFRKAWNIQSSLVA